MAIQADNLTAPTNVYDVVDDEFTIKIMGLETTRQYRFNKENSNHDKDDTQCPTLLTIRGPATIRGRNTAYKIEVSSGDTS